MKEIKFRAWDNVLKVMDLDVHVLDRFAEILSRERYNVMQYTGLKDKNGKEIYEGDIIEFDEKEWGGKDNIFTVTWDDKEGCWSWGGGAGSSDMEWRTVIGNIYENPELLKK